MSEANDASSREAAALSAELGAIRQIAALRLQMIDDITTERDRLRAALAELEDANDALCALRTRDQYLSMIDGGQQDALLRLDEARMAARTLVTPNSS